MSVLVRELGRDSQILRTQQPMRLANLEYSRFSEKSCLEQEEEGEKEKDDCCIGLVLCIQILNSKSQDLVANNEQVLLYTSPLVETLLPNKSRQVSVTRLGMAGRNHKEKKMKEKKKEKREKHIENRSSLLDMVNQ